ncbi:MAG: GntR family transcriptional regulator [Planctomycetota bacterium]
MTPPIHVHVSPNDDAPIYRQVVRQVVEGVASGALAPGERLPSLRAMAQQLAVAPLTVKKAYDVLEADGVIETRRGQGTFVSEAVARSTRSAVQRVRPLARRLVVEADVAGLDAHALAALIEEEARALENERASRGEAS